MLDLMRRQSQNSLIWGALAIVVFVFIFFFGPQTAGFSPGTRQWAAKVEGHTLYDSQVTARYLLRRDNRRPTDQEFATARQAVAEDMALVHGLAERAREAGLEVTDTELKCYIVNWHRGYRVNGELICRDFPADYETRYTNLDFGAYSDADGRLAPNYRQAVRGSFAMAVDEYEDYKRDELLSLKYLDMLVESLPVTPAAVEASYVRRNESVDVEYVRIDPQVGAMDPVTDAEVAAFTTSDSAAVAEYYAANQGQYATERTVRFRSIFIRRPAADDAGYAEAEARYNEMLARAQAPGEDFATLARSSTEAANEREVDGDMGLRAVENLSEQLVTALEGMSVGDVRGVEFSTFWRVVKLEEDNAARQRPLEEVQGEIARTLLESRARTQAVASARSRAERVLALASTTESLQAALDAEAAEHDAASGSAATEGSGASEGEGSGEGSGASAPSSPWRADSTGLFARERAGQSMGDFVLPAPPPDQIPGIGTSAEIARLLFSLTAESPLHPALVESDGALFILRLKERNAAALPVPDADYRTIERELRRAVADSLIARENSRRRLTLHMDGFEYGPTVAAILEELMSNGTIRLNAEVFAVDPVEALAE